MASARGMTFVLATMALALVASTIALGWITHRNAWRWGTVRGPRVDVGAGAYRVASIPTERERGVPWVVPTSAISGFVWAFLTFFGFAPAGALFALVLSESQPWFGIGFGLVAGDGFALAVALVVSGIGLVRCRAGAAARARNVARWSVAHHLAVVVVLALGGLAEHELGEFVLFSAIPCAIGISHAIVLYAAGKVREPEHPRR